MKHASFPVTGATPTSIGAAGEKKSGRTGFLTWIVEALHHSRRIQAQRFLRAHRHLIARDGSLRTNTGDDAHVDR
jgi:hypothetical protein